VLLSTSSVYPEPAAAGFEIAAALGYDGVEVMVWSDVVSQDASALLGLSRHYEMPIQAIHAPCLAVSQRVWSPDPWLRLTKAARLADVVGASIVVVHPPFAWQRDYAKGFSSGLDRLSSQFDTIRFAVENMYPLRVAGRIQVVPYSPGWDPTRVGHAAYTLDVSHCATAGIDCRDMAAAMGAELAHVHLADGTGRATDEHLVPGRGNQPCGELLTSLVERGFSGSVTVEVATRRAPHRERREADLREALDVTRAALASQTRLLAGHGHGPLPCPVSGDMGPGGAAFGAEAATTVGRSVEVDVSAPGVGADSTPWAAMPAQPDGQAPDRTSENLGTHRRSPTDDLHSPGFRVVVGDTRPDRKGDQQGIEFRHGLGAASGGTMLEHRPEATSGTLEHDEIAFGDAVWVPGVSTKERDEIELCRELGIDDIDGRERIRVEFH
jgi:sugar phosphate isomerase/epimerase